MTTPQTAATPPRRRFSAHAFELGLFSMNVAGGLTQVTDEIWDASWENNVTVARLAEEAGIGTRDLKRIEVVGLSIKDAHINFGPGAVGKKLSELNS